MEGILFQLSFRTTKTYICLYLLHLYCSSYTYIHYPAITSIKYNHPVCSANLIASSLRNLDPKPSFYKPSVSRLYSHVSRPLTPVLALPSLLPPLSRFSRETNRTNLFFTFQVKISPCYLLPLPPFPTRTNRHLTAF